MKKIFSEETVLFASVFKWIVLGCAVGSIVGTSTSIFLICLNFAIDFIHRYSFWYILTPAGLLISFLIVKNLAPDASGHGTEKVIEAVHRYSGYVKPAVIPIKLIATVITIAMGGSAGKEGPCAHIGAGLASLFAGITKRDDQDRKKIVICGISAAFASVFGTPIAGAIFGVEVLFVGSILYEVLLPSFVAGITSTYVTRLFGIKYLFNSVKVSFDFSGKIFFEVILAGFLFGIISRMLIEAMKGFNKINGEWKANQYLKILFSGIVILLITLLTSTDYLGMGVDVIEKSITGKEVVWYAFIIKIIFTAITLNFGGSGGIITPIFFIGATSGNIIGWLLGIDRSFTSALGFVSLLAGAANTPISASILAVEMFGPDITIYAALASVISFIMTGHSSVYPSQIVAIKKSASVKLETGKEIEEINPVADPLNNSIIKTVSILKDKIRIRPRDDFPDST